MAPAFLSQGLGIVYDRPSWGLYTRVAPITARQIIVTVPDIDETQFGVDSGKTLQSQYGASLRVDYRKELVSYNNFRLGVESRFSLFTDFADFGNFVTNWRNKVNFNVYKVFTISIIAHLIYDPSVLFPDQTQLNPDGTTTVLTSVPKVQFLQNIGFGIGYQITKRK
ncbi:MAG: hypothetical protein DDT42_01984 [candidate division WS2 bacterium]|uniref:Uncharacterized protein n=1 Tax=Psychracetigena formicireducens TaxID=2986056 RepID=A0A9E2BIV6_PSYF1|nr:hypothetical protein [Candidatus Psychracetigena formicireducens]